MPQKQKVLIFTQLSESKVHGYGVYRYVRYVTALCMYLFLSVCTYIHPVCTYIPYACLGKVNASFFPPDTVWCSLRLFLRYRKTFKFLHSNFCVVGPKASLVWNSRTQCDQIGIFLATQFHAKVSHIFGDFLGFVYFGVKIFFKILRQNGDKTETWQIVGVLGTDTTKLFCIQDFFYKWANTGLFFAYFRSFQQQFLQKNCRLQRDSNSDCWRRRQARWPLDHHLGPSVFKIWMADSSPEFLDHQEPNLKAIFLYLLYAISLVQDCLGSSALNDKNSGA